MFFIYFLKSEYILYLCPADWREEAALVLRTYPLFYTYIRFIYSNRMKSQYKD